MKVELTGFSQGVQFSKGPGVGSYLEFRTEDGKFFKVEVPQTALDEILAHVFEGEEGPETEEAEGVELQAPEGATEFGLTEQEEEGILPPDGRSYPQTEDEVPSL